MLQRRPDAIGSALEARRKATADIEEARRRGHWVARRACNRRSRHHNCISKHPVPNRWTEVFLKRRARNEVRRPYSRSWHALEELLGYAQ